MRASVREEGKSIQIIEERRTKVTISQEGEKSWKRRTREREVSTYGNGSSYAPMI